jgi:pimeloyl-ACP methyl ester carboxylesterase
VLAGLLGFGSVMLRTGRAIGRTWRAGGRQPIIVVGHSAGGIAARLAMADKPFNGRSAGVAEAVGCLVTLGTPHGLQRLTNRYHHAGHAALEFLDATTPGAFFAPRTSYLSVGGRTPGAEFPGLAGDVANEMFGVAVGRETQALGDGIVPFSAVHLDGATQLTYEDVRHGMVGAPWYGDDIMLDRWWPVALDLWREALAARSGALLPAMA